MSDKLENFMKFSDKVNNFMETNCPEADSVLKDEDGKLAFFMGPDLIRRLTKNQVSEYNKLEAEAENPDMSADDLPEHDPVHFEEDEPVAPELIIEPEVQDIPEDATNLPTLPNPRFR